MSNATITKSAAKRELDRRAHNRQVRATGEGTRIEASDPVVMKADGATLKALAGVTPKATTAKAAPKTATKAKATEVELTPFQLAVNADPEKFGVGFGSRRKARGLPSLTQDQREARKALFASLDTASA